jgi:5'-nucleotidase
MADGLDLRNARILLCNDDGIHAQGIAVLERIARSLADDVWIVAPETEQSAASHSLTIHRPLRLREMASQRFAVDGTPTDCALLAVKHVLKGALPTLVLSGVNHGSNLAQDIGYSGTVAAAIEATLLGLPAIALSLDLRPDAPPAWDTVERHGADVIRQICAAGFDPGVLVNVNFPGCAPTAVTGVRVVPQGRHMLEDQLTERLDPRGRRYFWIGGRIDAGGVAPGTDVAVVAADGIAVTPLHLDMTHGASIARLARTIGAEAPV